jgi:chromosome segregation ATPase
MFTPTVERAKELAEGILLIYDNGVFGPLLQADESFKRQHQALLDWYRQRLAEAEQANAENEKELDQLKQYEDLSREVLTNLTTQLWQIAVDKAGVEARIKACEKLRGKPDGANAEVERLKTAAEIELTGLQAREGAVKDVVAKGRKRAQLVNTLDRARLWAVSWEANILHEEAAVAYYEDQLKRYQPFPIVDNKVTIRPVKWQVVKPKG